MIPISSASSSCLSPPPPPVEIKKVRFGGRIYDARIVGPLKREESFDESTAAPAPDRIQIQLPCGIIVPPCPPSTNSNKYKKNDNSNNTNSEQRQHPFIISRSRDVLQMKFDARQNEYSAGGTSLRRGFQDITPKWLRRCLMLSPLITADENADVNALNKIGANSFSEINKLHVTIEGEDGDKEVEEEDEGLDVAEQCRQPRHAIIECYSVHEEFELGRPPLILFGKFYFFSPSSPQHSSFGLARESKAYEILIHLGLNLTIAPICYYADGENQVLDTTLSTTTTTSSSAVLLLQQLPITFIRFNPRHAAVLIDPKTGETLQFVPDVRPELKRVAVSLAALHESIFLTDDEGEEAGEEKVRKGCTQKRSRRAVVEQSLCVDRVFLEKWRLSLQPWGVEFLEAQMRRRTSLVNQRMAREILGVQIKYENGDDERSTTTFIHGSLFDHRHILIDRENMRSPATLVDWKRCGLGYREIDLLHLCACCLHPVMRREYNMVGFFLKEYVSNCKIFNPKSNNSCEEDLIERMKFVCKVLTMTKSESDVVGEGGAGGCCEWVPTENVRFELMRLLHEEWNDLSL